MTTKTRTRSSHPGSYTKVGQFPPSYRFLRLGDTCIFKATDKPKGWKPDAEINGKIVRIYLNCSNPHLIVSIDPTKHSMMSNLYVIYPKGAVDYNFYLKIKGTGLGSKLAARAREERKAAYQGDLFPKFFA